MKCASACASAALHLVVSRTFVGELAESRSSIAAVMSVSDWPGAAVAASRKKLPSSRECWIRRDVERDALARRRACDTDATSCRWRADPPTQIRSRRHRRRTSPANATPCRRAAARRDPRARSRISRVERRVGPTGAGFWPAGISPKYRSGELERPLGVDVARERQRRVRRVVVGAEERLHVFELHRADVVGRADRQPVIRMIRREQRRASAPSAPCRTGGSRSSAAAR